LWTRPRLGSIHEVTTAAAPAEDSPWWRFWTRRRRNWELRSCARHGHATYRPTEPALAERLRAETAVGEAWRCLRCGAFVPGVPNGHGPADHAPLVLRGRALRDAFVLRLLAAERLVRGALLVALAYGVHRFEGSQDALKRLFDDELPLLTPIGDRLGVDLQDSGPVHAIQRALETRHDTLTLVVWGILGYGALQLLEGVGLWMLRRWGEYVAVVGTSLFVPLEVHELLDRVTLLRVLALLVNLGAVAYLLYTKRLFGLRGGHRAFEAERHSASLIEVEQAAIQAELARWPAPRRRPPATRQTGS
jgi:uncharacterized membrane protein (DUF2068 family)